MPNAQCHVCGSEELAEIETFRAFKRVTSDCKPWPAGGRKAVCPVCGTVQAIIDDSWRNEIEEIYAAYSIYHQGGGAEQTVMDDASGALAARSERLTQMLKSEHSLPENGRLLDIGCGNGQFLKRFGQGFSGWSLAGSEYNDKYQAMVESLPQVDAFYTCELDGIPDGWDAISMVHVLEHIEQPISFLQSVRQKLNPDGYLIIEVPHFVDNPFELFIADHATHYTLDTLKRTVEKAGFTVSTITNQWVKKELSLVARPMKDSDSVVAEPMDNYAAFKTLQTVIHWLESVVKQGKTLSAESPCLGLFGTSIAGTWLYGELAPAIQFWVDEDPNRAGSTLMDLPIYSPKEVPLDSDVFVGLAPVIAQVIADRHHSPDRRYHSVNAIPTF